MKSQSIKIVATLAAIGVVGSTTAPVWAAEQASSPKEENVYVTLNQEGNVENVYVVNLFNLAQDGSIQDYGNYSAIKNLSNEQTIKQNQDEISVDAQKGSFYYQGNLESQQIPWNIKLTYLLDGKEISPQELGGKSGHLKIKGSVTQNKEVKGNFYDSFMIQAIFTLDTVKCRNIKAEGATAANVGANKQLTYMKLPKEDLTFEIEADVTDFSMEGASFNAVPLSLKLDKPDTKELDDQIEKLQDGVKDLDDGAKKLKDGSAALKDGSGKLQSGTQTLESGVNELVNGTTQLQGGANQLVDGTGTLFGGLSTLAGQSAALQNGASQIFDSLLQAANIQMQPVLEQVGIAFTPLTKENYSQVLAQINGQIGGVALQKATEEAQKKVTQQVTEIVTQQVEQQVQQVVQQTVTQQVYAGKEQVQQAVTKVVKQEILQKITPEQMLAAAYQIISLDPNFAQATEEQKKLAAMQLVQQKPDELKEQIANLALVSPEVTQKIEETVEQKLQELVAQTMQSEQIQQKIKDETQNQLNSTQIQGLIAMQIETVMASDEVQKQIADIVAQATGADSVIVQKINGLATQLNGFHTFYNGLMQYTGGVNAACEGAAKLKNGATSLQSGISQLSGGAQSLQQGASALKDGAQQLFSGVTELQNGTGTMADGTNELREKTADMDSRMQEEIDKLLDEFTGKDAEIQSFVSDKNTNVESVQFVMSTEAIEQPEEEVQPVQEQEEKQSFWQRLVQLFR